jgi:hypothetical protein
MQRLGWRLRLAGIRPDELEQVTGIQQHRVWPPGTTAVQVGTPLSSAATCKACTVPLRFKLVSITGYMTLPVDNVV